MTELQGTELLAATQNVYLALRALLIVACLLFGGLVFVSYKLGRKP